MNLINEKELYFDQCESFSKEKICKSRGGESCALDGALIVLQPIADALHIIHSPINCCSLSYDGRGAISDKGFLNHMGFTTDMNELNIVYGSEEKLKKHIIELDKKYNPKGIFVYLSCVSGLIGEDIESVCTELSIILKKIVVPVPAPGFVGPKNLGNRIAGDALIKYVIGTHEPDYLTDFDINLIGEYNIAGDLYEIEHMLKRCGLRVLSRITGNSSFTEIRYAHRAKLNILLCGRSLINIAHSMKNKYGIDFVEASFYGPTEIKTSLRETAKKLRSIHILRNVESFISDFEKEVDLELKKYQLLKGKKALLYSGGVKGWSLISALKDMEIEIAAVITKKMSYHDEEKAKKLLNKDAAILEKSDATTIKRFFSEKKADILIAGGRNKYLAIKELIPFVDVNQERHRAYAGIKGFFNLCQDILNAYVFYTRKSSPVNKKPIITEENYIENPLKLPQSLGAVIALQGFKNVLPIIHSAQGCNFLSKVLLIKHFREPICISTSNLFTEDIVMGSEEKLIETIERIVKNKKPSLIALLSASLSEIRGSFLESLTNHHSEIPKAVIKVPDYQGGLEDGYTKAVYNTLSLFLDKKPILKIKKNGVVNLIAGSHLTPMDFNEIREMFHNFGLKVNLIPDLSSLDGSGPFAGSIIASGFDLKNIKDMVASELTIVVGRSLEPIGKLLKEKAGIDYKVIDFSLGLRSTDNILKLLIKIGRTDNYKKTALKRERAILEDLIKDAQFYLFGKKASLALEPDAAVNISNFLDELGVRITKVVVPQKSPSINFIKCEEIIMGGLENLDESADLWIASSRARHKAKRLCIPLLQFGYPSYSYFGANLLQTVGYKAAIRFLSDLVNTIKGETI